jgi:hypothetical protein
MPVLHVDTTTIPYAVSLMGLKLAIQHASMY